MITVIGGGPAGRLASIRLALEGREVILVEKSDALGGQCLHKGCMVICALNDIARSLDDCRNYRKLGLFCEVPSFDFPSVMAEMKRTHEKISGILDSETRESGVEVVRAEARIEGREVFIDGDKTGPDEVIIATGSVPSLPPVEGGDLEGVYTPHTITGITELPGRIAIIGGGVIAAEYAYIFSSFGVETMIISRSSFLRGKPRRMVESVKRELSAVDIRESCSVDRIEGTGSVSGVTVSESGASSEIEADAVLMAAGLVPNSGMVSGIAKGPGREIIVDSRMETDVSGVYAAGDVTGPPYLTPVARMQGIMAADSILSLDPGTLPGCIPQSVKLRFEHSFCGPPDDCETEVSLPSPSGPGSFWRVHEGYTGRSMIATDNERKRICGMYIGSPGSGPISAYMAHLISGGAGISDLSSFLEVHPSTDGIPALIKYLAQLKEKD